MTHVRAAHIDYTEDEEHIVRRLGGAVIAQFSSLPKEVQTLLIEQATFMHDRHETMQLKEQIEAFIEARAS
jgi:hypothetical protein